MASAGGSGSSSKNLSLSSGNFNQSIWGPQGNALTNLYNNANGLYDNTVGNMQGQLPGVINSQMGVAGSAAGGANNLLNGGAFSGITGQGVMNNITGAMVNPNQAPGTTSPTSLLGGNMQGQSLPGMIGTSQNGMLDMLRPTTNTQNNLLPNNLLDPMNGVGKMNNTSNIYNDIMNGTGNAYVGGMKDQIMRNAKLGLDGSLNSIDQRAAAGGMGGSTRQGIAQGMAASAANQNMQDQLTNLGYNTFDKDLTNKLNIAQQADTNATNRYLGNLNYNQGLVNAGNTAAQNNMNYNTNLGGLGNQANQNNMNYNLGYGANVNTGNNNLFNYGSSLYNSGTNLANSNAMAAGNALNYNGQLMSMLPSFAQGAQDSINSGMSAMPGVSQLYGAGLNSSMAPFQALSGYADALGGPVVLGNGKYKSMGQGSSKGGGGGVSVGSVG